MICPCRTIPKKCKICCHSAEELPRLQQQLQTFRDSQHPGEGELTNIGTMDEARSFQSGVRTIILPDSTFTTSPGSR